MKIRKASVGEVGSISRLIRKAVDNLNYGKFSSNQIASWKQFYSSSRIKDMMKKGVVFVAIDSKNIIGTVSLIENHVYALYIKPELKRKGIGRKLMIFIEAFAKSKEISTIYLSSTPVSLKFYKKIGYIPKGKIKINFGRSYYLETKMQKIIKNKKIN